jgi:hypothetical protein
MVGGRPLCRGPRSRGKRLPYFADSLYPLQTEVAILKKFDIALGHPLDTQDETPSQFPRINSIRIVSADKLLPFSSIFAKL